MQLRKRIHGNKWSKPTYIMLRKDDVVEAPIVYVVMIKFVDIRHRVEYFLLYQ